MAYYDLLIIGYPLAPKFWKTSPVMSAQKEPRFQNILATAGPVLFWSWVFFFGNALATECSELTASIGLRCNGRASEIISLQQQLANNPEDTAAQDRLKALLAQIGATGAAQDLPSGALLRERTWWRDLLPSLQRSAWVAIELGHDSNINSGTADEVVNVPLLNYRSLSLDPLFVQTDSPFVGVRFGALARFPLGAFWALRAGGMAAMRLNSAQYVYFPHSYEGRLGLERDFGLWRVEAGVSGNQRWLAIFQATGRRSVYAQATRLFEYGLTGQVYAEHSRNHYPQFLEAETGEDAITLTMAHSGTGLRGTITNGKEKAIGVTKSLDRNYSGYTISWVKEAFAGARISLSLSGNQVKYDETSPLFLTARRDRMREYSIAYEHRLADNWTITPRYVREENRSSVSLMRYDRTQWMIEARKEF